MGDHSQPRKLDTPALVLGLAALVVGVSGWIITTIVAAPLPERLRYLDWIIIFPPSVIASFGSYVLIQDFRRREAWWCYRIRYGRLLILVLLATLYYSILWGWLLKNLFRGL